MVPESGRGKGCDRGMEAALQLSSPALKPEQHDARTLLSAVRKKLEPWGNPQELSGPKFPGRSRAIPPLQKKQNKQNLLKIFKGFFLTVGLAFFDKKNYRDYHKKVATKFAYRFCFGYV